MTTTEAALLAGPFQDAGDNELIANVRLSFRAPIEPAIRGVMKPLRSGVFGVSDRLLFTSF